MILTVIGEKFTIKSVCFQDPCFTENDKKFLQQRGHTVLDWDAAALEVPGGYAIDPQLLSSISTSTMCYLPFLPLTAIVEVISAAKPSLYFGSDLVGTTVQRVLVSAMKSIHPCSYSTDVSRTKIKGSSL